MRTILLLLFLSACADPYGDAQKIDTVEAWEAFLTTDPSGSARLGAEARLEVLLVGQATGSAKVEDYDTVLKRFPRSRQVKKMRQGRANAAYALAEAENTPEAWKRFLDENKEAEGAQLKKATARVQVAEYQDKLVIGEVKVEEVSLAEDPKGPKDGWGFSVEVANTGDKTMDYLNMEVQLLDAGGAKLSAMSYPLAGTTAPGGLSLPEEYTKPFGPGDKRVWKYATGDIPEGWSKQARVVPIGIRFTASAASK